MFRTEFSFSQNIVEWLELDIFAEFLFNIITVISQMQLISASEWVNFLSHFRLLRPNKKYSRKSREKANHHLYSLKWYNLLRFSFWKKIETLPNLHLVIETFFAITAPKIIAQKVQQKCPKHPPMNTAYIF